MLARPGLAPAAALVEEINAESAVRERDRIAPYEQIELLARRPLRGAAVPREYGGAGTTRCARPSA